jgi:ADP-ribose pyrophosphatase
MSITWVCKTQKYIISTKWLKVRRDTVQLSNNVILDDYYVIEKNDVALIIAINDSEEIILKREYRYPINQFTIELPGGTFNKETEHPLDTAKRELLEETGFEAKSWQNLGYLYDYPTKDTNKVFVFVAKNIERISGQKLDATEDILYEFYSLDKVKDLIANGEINVSGTVAGILKYLITKSR